MFPGGSLFETVSVRLRAAEALLTACGLGSGTLDSGCFFAVFSHQSRLRLTVGAKWKDEKLASASLMSSQTEGKSFLRLNVNSEVTVFFRSVCVFCRFEMKQGRCHWVAASETKSHVKLNTDHHAYLISSLLSTMPCCCTMSGRATRLTGTHAFETFSPTYLLIREVARWEGS